MVLTSLLWGAFSGALYGLNGWFKKHDPKTAEEFKPAKFALPVVIGAIVGVAAWYWGLSFDLASQNLAQLGLLSTIEIGLAAGIKNLLKKLK